MRPTTICFINQKGGCGKSSSCFHLAGCFAERGLRVLVVDADPQGSLGQAFFGSSLIENLPVEATLAAVFDDRVFVGDPRRLLRATGFDNLWLIPANQRLARHNLPSPEETGMKQQMLATLLEEVEDIDLVLIDCPPNLYLCSWNALVAADYVVVPVPPEDFATQGLRVVGQAVDSARQLNSRLKLLGYLVTRVDRRLLVHRAYDQKLRSLYQDCVFSTVVPEASAFKVALACRQPISYHNPRSRAAQSVLTLANEITERMRTARLQEQVA